MAKGMIRAAVLALGLLVPAAALAAHNTGHTQWTGNGFVGADMTTGCAYCHGSTPPTMQLNGAGNTAAVLNHVIPLMGCNYADALSGANRIAVAQYLLSRVDGSDGAASLLFTASNTTTPMNTQRTISASTHVNVGGYAFGHIETVSISNATLTWSGETGTFTPTTGFVGDVTFTYRGRDTRSGANISGHTYTGVVRVGSAPTLSGNSSHDGTYNSAITTYQLTASPLASNTVFSVFSGTLPPGLSLNSSTGAVTGTPTSVGTGTYNVTFRASNSLGNSNTVAMTFNIARATPTVTLGLQSAQTYSPSGTFNVSAASITPAQAVTDGVTAQYRVIAGSTACSKNGATTTTTFNLDSATSPATCTVEAFTAQTSNWAAADSTDRSVTINKANQTVSFSGGQGPVNWSNGGNFTINPLATTTAAAQTGIAIAYASGSPTICSVAGTTVSNLRAGTCVVQASEDGNTNYNASNTATQNITISAVAPSAPTIGTATPADTQASIAFTPLTTSNDGGASIQTYRATCNPGGITATNTASPILVTGLTNGQMYSCSVTATQVAPYSLTSAASGTVNVTPAVYPAITSANNTTFTVLVPGTFNVTATGSPAPTILLSGTLPSGVTFNGPGGSPRTLSGTPASGTVGTYPLVFTADGSDPDATQNFTLTVAKRSQTVSMVDPADRLFGSGNVALSATATSGLPVTFTSLTPAVCGISVGGTEATLLDVGTCTIRGSQAGDGDWAASTITAGDTQSFTISQGAQSITFATQVPATRVIAPGQTFNISPTGTATSGLAVTYDTLASPSICTYMGGVAVRMDNVGTCTITARQTGDTKWQAATPVPQDVSLTIASQVVTFPAQAAQNYLLNGTFAINPPASADSGLSVAYTSDTTSVCTVTGTTVSIVAAGTCTLRATQAGNNNYTSATATANVQIQAVVPKAPTIGAVSAGNQHAKVNFTPPADDGGSPITDYIATCGAITANGTTSPITVTGLTNGQLYSCSVAAVNALGTGASSASANVTPNLMGASLWASNCQSCHSPTPSGARFNYAGSSLSTQVLDYVINTNPEMNVLPNLQALNSLERLDLKAYISGFLAAISESTNPNLPKTISVGSHLSLNTVFQGGAPGSFTHVVIDTPPANGTLSVFNGVEVVYTPNPGYTGPDSFTYHGQRTSPTVVTGDTHTVTINVTAAAPLLTVSKDPTGTGTGLVFSDTPTNGIDCGSDCTEAYNNGQVVTLFATASPGSTFIGWTGDCTGSSVACNVTMSAARNVVAKFDLTPFDLAVSRTGAGTGTVTSSPGGVNCGATCTVGFPPGTVVTLTPTPAAGSAFTSWAGACSGSGACSITMDAAKSVTANFEPTYVLSVAKAGAGTGAVSSSPAGIDCGATCSAEFLTGTSVTLTPVAAAGSAFTGWSGACTGTGACTVSMTVARSVTANFTPVYTLTYTKLGNGSGTVVSTPAGINCTSSCTADYLDTTVVNLSATIGADTEFLGWGGECSGTGACSVTMSQARNVTANFKSSIALTVTINGSGSGVVASSPEGIGVGCGSGCTVGFDPGTVVTLGRSPAAGSIFAGWSGACTGTGACVLTMSQSRSVTATFNLAGGPQADVGIAAHTSNPPSAASIGQQVTFTLTVANNGPAGATNVVLTDTLPTAATFVSASPGCTHNAGTVTCAIGSLANGASAQVQIVVQPTAAGGATNFASVTSAESDPLSFNNASALAISVAAAANLGRLTNISTRGLVQTGDNVMIGGFIIGGAASKTVVVRARGPSLAQFGVPGVLANPRLQLFSGQNPIASNDNWGEAANAAAITASGFAPSDPNEAAILMQLAPGAYTAIVTGVGGGTGIAIVEVFEVDAVQIPLANISTRGLVSTGDAVMIGGFIIQGDGPQSVVIRARGPSLAQFGVQGVLANPQVQLFSGNTQVAANDNWGDATNAAAVTASGFAPTDPLEAALLVTLQPGAYTVIMTGVAGGTGIGIVEVFRN